MRRAAGAHVRSNRQKLALLQRTTLANKNIAPSLRSDYVKRIIDKQNRHQKIVEALAATPNLIADRPPTKRRSLRRRSFPKEESPRSGLKPHDTLGVDDRRQSSCSLAERRLEEHRKYSSYGIESPIPLDLSKRKSETPSPAPEVVVNTPILQYRAPQRSLSAGWKESFRKRLHFFRRQSPSTLSSRSTQQFLCPSPELSVPSSPDSTKMKKSISFTESTCNVVRRSFRHKVGHLLTLFQALSALSGVF